TYSFQFITHPVETTVYLGVTAWYPEATILLDKFDYAVVGEITPSGTAGLQPAGTGLAVPGPVDIGSKTVWIFDEPGFPEVSKADAGFWESALKAAGHRTERAGVEKISALEKKTRKDVDVIVFPNRGHLPVDCEPAITELMAEGGAIVVTGNMQIKDVTFYPELCVPQETLDKIYAGEMRADQLRLPNSKWLRKNAEGSWATPWRLYARSFIPYVSDSFQLLWNYSIHINEPALRIPKGTVMRVSGWLEPYNIPMPPSLQAPDTMRAVVPLRSGYPDRQRYIPLYPEYRNNIYLSLYTPVTDENNKVAAGNAFVMRYRSPRLPAGTLVHLGDMSEMMLDGERGKEVAAGLVNLACQPALPGQHGNEFYERQRKMKEKIQEASKAYFAAEDYLQDNLQLREKFLPEMTGIFSRILLLENQHYIMRDEYPFVLPRETCDYFRSLGKMEPMAGDIEKERFIAGLLDGIPSLADTLMKKSERFAKANNAGRLLSPFGDGNDEPLIFGGGGWDSGGFRHVAKLYEMSAKIGFRWVNRSGKNEPWMGRLYKDYGIKEWLGFGYYGGFATPDLYDLNEKVLHEVTGIARLFKDKDYVAAHGVGCEIMPYDASSKLVQEHFRKHLKEKYYNLDALNHFWGVSHGAWEEILPPRRPQAQGTPEHAAWEDFTRFNQMLFERFNRKISHAIRQGDPGKYVLSQFHEAVGSRVEKGLNKFLLHQYEDLDGTHETTEKNDWLHFGLAPLPICNDEWHGVWHARGGFLGHANRRYERMGIELAQGPTAGWLDYNFQTPNPYLREKSFFDTGGEPYPVAWQFKYLIPRFQKAGELNIRGANPKARVAMLHSDTAFRHTAHLNDNLGTDYGSIEYMNERTGWYTLLRYAGIPVQVVDETQATPSLLRQFDFLLVPFAPYLPENVAGDIEAYVSAGGTAVFQLQGIPLWGSYGRLLSMFDGRFSEKITNNPTLGKEQEMDMGDFVYRSWQYSGRFHTVPAELGEEVLATYRSGEPAMTRFDYGRGKVIVVGAPVALDLGRWRQHDAAYFLPLLENIGINDTYRFFRMLKGTAFTWLREMDGETYLWAVCGDIPDAVEWIELEFPGAAELLDVLTGEALQPSKGVFKLGVSAPGIRLLKVVNK
ncbi:MAG: beta-galactosidase, partial [Victivallales bacterium]|nr:beta-galactosidase [Victivallales bacterium]